MKTSVFDKTTIATICKAPQKAGFFGDPAAINVPAALEEYF